VDGLGIDHTVWAIAASVNLRGIVNPLRSNNWEGSDQQI
jgi:hypothetical protein